MRRFVVLTVLLVTSALFVASGATAAKPEIDPTYANGKTVYIPKPGEREVKTIEKLAPGLLSRLNSDSNPYAACCGASSCSP